MVCDGTEAKTRCAGVRAFGSTGESHRPPRHFAARSRCSVVWSPRMGRFSITRIRFSSGRVPYAEASGLGGAGFEVQTVQGSPLAAIEGASVTPQFSPRINGPKTAQLRLEPGKKYVLQISQKREGGESVLKSKPMTIEIKPTNDWLLPLFAITSALCALGIFIWTWISLNPKTSRLHGHS
jgi:hypothetical protein